jgi:predicted esterase
MRSGITASIVLAFCLAAAGIAVADSVVFSETTPLADLGEIERRTRPPLYASRITAYGQGVDPAKESYVLHVPAQRPPQGYALLVFVPPWDEARLPAGWAAILDEHGVIFASAHHSSNQTDIRSRRMPLALIATASLTRKYAIDPSRVLIGGFSGGAIVAMRLALAYPDVFHGALLDSSGDPIGNVEVPIPSADLFRKFQEESRLFYITGDNEPKIQTESTTSMHSMRDWCVFHIDQVVMPHTGHDVANPSALDRALTALLGPETPSGDDLASCRAGVQSRLDARLRSVEELLAKGDKAAAGRALDEVDAEFGGLAAPRSLELDAKVAGLRGP